VAHATLQAALQGRKDDRENDGPEDGSIKGKEYPAEGDADDEQQSEKDFLLKGGVHGCILSLRLYPLVSDCRQEC